VNNGALIVFIFTKKQKFHRPQGTTATSRVRWAPTEAEGSHVEEISVEVTDPWMLWRVGPNEKTSSPCSAILERRVAVGAAAEAVRVEQAVPTEMEVWYQVALPPIGIWMEN